jgi:DNA excision repair protein ERCC-2
VRAAQRLAPSSMRRHFEALVAALDEAEAEPLRHADQPGGFRRRAGTVALQAVPEPVGDAVKALNQRLAGHFRRRPKATGPLLEFHFELMHVAALLDSFGEHSLLSLQRGPQAAAEDERPKAGTEDLQAEADEPQLQPQVGQAEQHPQAQAEQAGQTDQANQAGLFEPEPGQDLVLAIDNVVPAPFLAPRWRNLHAAVLFSATLSPPQYARDLLGMPADTAWLDVPPAFPPEHLQVRVAAQVSTRWRDRARTLPALAAAMAAQYDAHPGNYLAFFSSHTYLHQAAQALAAVRPDIPQWRQARTMAPGQRQTFLARFTPEGRGIGFAVLGGVFAEGVDLPGSRLIGAFIATLGLPPVSPSQTRLREKLDTAFGPGHGYADLVPAMQKVVQAAGRVLRTPDDRGWLWLLDDRYTREEITRLLPT